MGQTNKRIADSIIDAAKRIYLRGINTTMSGNISAKISSNTILITPSALDKFNIDYRRLSLMDFNSERLISGPRQSSEYQVHTHIYRARKDVNAIVHPHPQYSLAIIDALGRGVLKELAKDEEYRYYIVKLGVVGRIPAGTKELADAVAKEVSKGARVVIMEGHGTVGVGKTMQEALGAVEYLEHMAKKLFIIKMLGK